jgi:dihydroflavonol-4-reductase
MAAVVAVTGANGHVGNNLVRALLARGREVRALVLGDCASVAGLPLETVEGDVRDLGFLRRALSGVRVVYHTAARISLLMDDGPEVRAVNVRGVQNVVQACQDCGIERLVHFSSIHAYVQEPLRRVLDESRPLVSEAGRAPPYDRSKADGERLVRAAAEQGLSTVVLNPTGIIGPGDFGPSPFGRVLAALGRGALPVIVGGGFDWVDVRDVIDASLRAEEAAPAGARYLLSGHWVTNRELAATVSGITGAPAPRLVVPLAVARLAAPFATAWARWHGKRALLTAVALRDLRGNRCISHARAAAELGFTPRPLDETLADTLRWFGDRPGRSPVSLPHDQCHDLENRTIHLRGEALALARMAGLDRVDQEARGQCAQRASEADGRRDAK